MTHLTHVRSVGVRIEEEGHRFVSYDEEHCVEESNPMDTSHVVWILLDAEYRSSVAYQRERCQPVI